MGLGVLVDTVVQRTVMGCPGEEDVEISEPADICAGTQPSSYIAILSYLAFHSTPTKQDRTNF